MKKTKKILLFLLAVVLVLIFTGSSIYYLNYIYIPRKHFIELVLQFDSVCREGNADKIKSLLSKESHLFEFVDKLEYAFNRFDKEIDFLEISYIPNLGTDSGYIDSI